MADLFDQHEEAGAFDELPDLRGYRIYIFLNNSSVDEMQKQLAGYYELYSDESAFSAEVRSLAGTPWTCLALTLRAHVSELPPVWDYLNILLWMSDKAVPAFAYAYSEQPEKLPFFAQRDWGNPDGDSCIGIAMGRNFRASVPAQELSWQQELPEGFDYRAQIMTHFGVDVGRV
ncbi:MAG: hypothetical protein K5697_05990 [Lachnospiraceae bacterium]|nr:hypothetical protein [Lachnospiraceae bacterium]